ncbi:MAG: glutathione-disulfide reductase, partial [Halothece sp. Uz-M2-17]|nr:glutathione-disulfide reductase [Halothece sp. Uz-M2-17]
CSCTTVPNVFAVGDCTDRINLTPVAIQEGRAFADTEFGGKDRIMSHENVPSAVFTSPEAATVGFTEAEAREQFGEEDIKIYRARFGSTYFSVTQRKEKAMLKLVVQKSSDRVLGAHMVGEAAAEIMQGVAIPIKMGATKADFDATVAIHPSVAEEFVTMR